MYIKTIYPVLISLITLLSCKHKELIKHECSDISCVSSRRDLSSDEGSVVTQANDKHTIKSDTISIVSSAKSSSTISSTSGRAVVTPFEKLSTEEKTAVFLEFSGYGCDQIYYPTNAVYKNLLARHNIALALIKNGFEKLLQTYHLNQQELCFETSKVASSLLVCYKNETEVQYIQGISYKTFLCESAKDRILHSKKAVIEKIKFLNDQIKPLQTQVEKVSLVLNQSTLLYPDSLTKNIKEYIDHYNSIVKEEDKFSKEEVDNFCSKIIEYRTYGEFKEHLQYLTNIMDDFSSTVHRHHHKVRFLGHLKYFILSINPDINKQSEDIKRLKAELLRLQKNVKKYYYFFLIEPISVVLAEGYLEHFLLEDLDLSTQDIKKDREIEKVYMLVYASDDICNACTNAMPKVQSLISEKFHQQGVTVDPSDVDVLYLPISKKKEVDLDRLIIKRIK